MSTLAEKEAAKAAKLAEKEAAKADDDSANSDEIIVNEPINLKQELPLVVILPKGASEAQIERAKTLNAYAYKNPVKWAVKKNKLIAELKALKNAPPKAQFGAGKLTYGHKPLPGSEVITS